MLVRDPVPSRTRSPRGAGTWHGHQFPEPGQPQPGEPTPGLSISFTSPNAQPKSGTDPKPSPTATVATTTCNQEALQFIQARVPSCGDRCLLSTEKTL